MLGNLDKLAGTVELNGSVAYVAQEAWIQNTTLKNNVLFGKDFDERRYQRAVTVCELQADIAMLPAGDQTEIGEKGINLSGGQKQRVSMARAVYADADVYLLDDPLSAVDAHVGKSIFENCIVGALRGKTRILVTHQLQYLSKVDLVVVIKDHTFAEIGTYEELMAAGLDFADLMNKHVVADDEETDGESDSESAAGTPLRASRGGIRDSRGGLKASQGGKAGDHSVEEQKQGATLIKQEEREIGEVKASIYLSYIMALGGALMGVCIIVSFFTEQASKVFADMYVTCLSHQRPRSTRDSPDGRSLARSRWVSWWTDNTNAAGEFLHSNLFYLGIYTLIGVANAAASLARGLLTAVAGINSARSLHDELLTNLLRVPMSFFDTTPVGRILNRFSKDQYVIDEALPRTLSMFITMLFAAASVLVVIGIVTPFFLAALLPLGTSLPPRTLLPRSHAHAHALANSVGWVYRFVQAYYLRSSRELKRLDSISRSPIYAHFGETLTGVNTIRAFGRVQEFMQENAYRLDTNQRAFFASNSSNRWLGIRLEFLGTIVVTLAALFAVLERDNIKAGAAGLSITYALQTTSLLNWMVRMYTEVETQMVSVERLQEYAVLEREADPIIPHSRPPASWPDAGRIHFENLQFRYREGLPLVLKGITVDIRPKEKIGIVGRTGAGKSTLMLALFRLVEVRLLTTTTTTTSFTSVS